MAHGHLVDRLFDFYGQLSNGGCKKVYGRIINMVQHDRDIRGALAEAKSWHAECRRHYVELGWQHMATDYAASGCLVSILSEA